jgi:predicted DNA-binding transcriptional regulator YafY
VTTSFPFLTIAKQNYVPSEHETFSEFYASVLRYADEAERSNWMKMEGEAPTATDIVAAVAGERTRRTQVNYSRRETAPLDIEMTKPERWLEVMEASPLRIWYTNHRGERAERNIIPRKIVWGSTRWHPQPQWILHAWDLDRQAERSFAVKDFGGSAVKIDPASEKAVEIVRLVDELRSDEGDSVTIINDNPDFHGPSCAIECNGEWCGWQDKRFTGDTVLDCLRNALVARSKAKGT